MYKVGTAVGLLMASTLFLSTHFGDVPTVQASTTTQTTSETTSSQFDTSQIHVGTGDYAFESRDSSMEQINGNQFVGTFVSNVTVIHAGTTRSSIVYSNSSQLITIYKTDEDLSGATYSVTNRTDGSIIDSGRFQKVTIDGQSYDAMILPSTVIQASFEANQTDQSSLKITINNGSTETSTLTSVAVKTMAASASVKLPTISADADGQTASSHFGSQTATLVDANGQSIDTVALTNSDITVSDDGTDAHDYSYRLNSTGANKVQKKLDQLNQTALSDGGFYYTADTQATGTLTLHGATTTETNLVVTYVDEAGHTVKTDTISGNVGDSGHYTAKVPSGYELAAGQSAETAYTLSSGTNTMTIKLQKKAVTPTKTPAVLKVDYIDENGNVVTTDTVSGHVGDTGTYSATAPSGYVLGNGQDATVSYTLGQTTNTLTISVQRQPAIVTVKYVNGDGTVVGTKNITGRVGDQVDLSESVPDGYKLEDNPIGSHYTLTGNQTAVTLKVVSVDQTPTSLITVQTPQDVSTAPILPRALWPLIHQRATKPVSKVQSRHHRRINKKTTAKARPTSKSVPKSSATSTRPVASAQQPANKGLVVGPTIDQSAAVTVLYLDGRTGHTLATELLTGKRGDRIVFDTYQQILPLQEQGYYITSDDTTRINAAYFGDGPTTFRVTLLKREEKPTTPPVPAKTPQASASGRSTPPSHAVADKSAASKSRHKTHVFKEKAKKDQSSPVVFDPEINAILTPSGHGGGNPDATVTELGKFFISLSGTINFGIQNKKTTTR
ncbi:hypothetical protein FC96_GL000911 [Secundilactobacillus kimchicus JCM 15530]|uniref:Mucin binding domain-containing protein n=2 Tax=Secundilactobacillus kimchicus TaxID=528209 RepID=A0A0R1HQT9_9LACO|nr:hypothetical protein FC96_GL000911 [Secundilactobacillus kimchicus JCM 15530]